MYSKETNSELGCIAGAILLVLVAILCGSFAMQEARAETCIRNGYTPVYATYGQGIATVKYCERVIDGRSEVISPDELN